MTQSSAPFGTVLTAMVTPFDDAGRVDHRRAAELARYLVDAGSDGLVVCGTTGESPTLTADEKLALFGTVVDAVGARAKVVAGTGSYDTAASVSLTRRAAETGVDGILAVAPYYNKPTQAGLVAHFTSIADATALPLMIYNIPGRTAVKISVETLGRLAGHPRIVAVKDAVMDLDFTTRTVAEVPGLAVYSGQDTYTWPMMAVGAVGVVSVISHLAGPEVKKMVDAAHAGNVDEARRMHLALFGLGIACFVETNPAPVKAALSELWQPVGDPRLPLVGASPDVVAGVVEAVERLHSA